MTPPYNSDVRCVIWAAADRSAREAASSSALAFAIRLDDGGEVVVEPAGASAMLAIRWGIAYQLEESADGRSQIVALGPSGRIGEQKGSTITKHARVVAWVAVGDEVTVEGRLLGAPFRGRQVLAATKIQVEGGWLEVAALELGEAEPLAEGAG